MEGRLGGRMEARMEAMIEERMEDRVEVYEAQMDQKHYHGFSPTPYNYQVQSKSFLRNKKNLPPRIKHKMVELSYQIIRRILVVLVGCWYAGDPNNSPNNSL